MRGTAPGAAVVAVLAVLVASAAAAFAASDPYRPQQWGLDRIGAPEAWARSDGAGVVVAVLDTGVDLDHPDLRDRFLRDEEGRIVGRDLVDGDAVPQDENGHGTMVAGIAVATMDNGEGVAGVAPGAWLMPIRVLAADGSGRYAHLDEGIRWAVDHGADVINLSLERADEPDTVGRTLEGLTTPVSAVQYAWDRGVVVVAAAGNSGNDATDYPEDSPVLLVGASDREDRKAGFSDAGRRDAVLAPGIDVVSTWCDPDDGACAPTRRYGVASGTSFAAPSVTGGVALLLAQGRDHREAVERIRGTARDLGPRGPDDETGVGRVDLAAAAAPEPLPPAPSPSPQPSASEAGDDVSSAGNDGAPTTPAAPSPPAPSATPTRPGATDAPRDEPTSGVAPPTVVRTPTAPSPVAAPVPPSDPDRAAWLGLASVLLAATAGAVAIGLYRHGGFGRPGAERWGQPAHEVKFRP